MSESEIFKEAVKLSPDRRAAYLDEACGANSELRREVDSLVRAHDAPESLVGTNFWRGGFRIVGKGSGTSGAGKVEVHSDHDNLDGHDFDNCTISFNKQDSYEIKLTNLGTKLTIGGQTFDVYGEPRTIRIRQDGSVH